MTRGKLTQALIVALCWTIIAAIAITIPVLGALRMRAATTPGAVPATQSAEKQNEIGLQFQIGGKYVVGAGELDRKSAPILMGQLYALGESSSEKLVIGIVTAELIEVWRLLALTIAFEYIEC